MTAVRLAGGFASTREAEHAYRGGHAYAATVFDPVERVVLAGADSAADLTDRARLFVFPGHEQLLRRVSVRELASVVDEVRGLGGVVPDPDAVVETQGFVRPVVEGGRVVLVLRPFDDGTRGSAAYVPFEQPSPTPCCADHS